MRVGWGLTALSLALATLAPHPAAAQVGLGGEGGRMIPGGQPLLAASPLPSPSPGVVLGASPSPAAGEAAPIRSAMPAPATRPSQGPLLPLQPGLAPRPSPSRPTALSPGAHWEAPIWDPSLASAMRQVPVGYNPQGQAIVFLPDPGVVPLLVERNAPPRLVLRLPAGHRWAPGLPGETWPVRGPSGPVAQVQVSQDGQELLVAFVGARPRYALVPAADGRLAIAFGGPERAAAALAASPRPVPSPLPEPPTPTPSILITPEPVPWRSGGPVRPTPTPSPLVALPTPAPSPPPGTQASPMPAPSPSEGGLVVVTPPPLPPLPNAWASEAPALFGGQLSLQGEAALNLQEQLPADGLNASADLVPGARLRWEPLLSPNVGLVAQLTGMGAKYDQAQLRPLGLEGLLSREAYDLNLSLLGRLPLPGGLELAASPGILARALRAEASAGRPGALATYRSSAWRDASTLSYGGLLGLSAGWRPWEALAFVLQGEGYGLVNGVSDPSGGLRPYPLLGVRAEAQLRLLLGPVGLSAGYVVVEELAAAADTTRNQSRRWSGPSVGVGLRF